MYINDFACLLLQRIHFSLPSICSILTDYHPYGQDIAKYQVVNHFPANKHLSSKALLVRTINNSITINQQSQAVSKTKHVFDICPATFYFPCSLSRLSTDQANVWFEFSKRFHELSSGRCGALRLPAKHCLGNLWIAKPAYGMDGTGLRIFNDIRQLKRFLQAVENDWVVQKCIERPLLINNRKVSMRTWMLVTDSFDVFIHRQPHFLISSEDYEMTGEHIADGETGYNRYVRRIHFTSSSVQQESNNFGEQYLGNIMYLADMKKHLQQDTTIPPDSLESVLLPRVRKILADSVRGCMMRLREGVKGRRCFEIFSADFVIDEDLRPWLIDISENPCLDTPTDTHEALVDGMIRQAVSLAIDPLFPPILQENAQDTPQAIELKNTKITVEDEGKKGALDSVVTGRSAVAAFQSKTPADNDDELEPCAFSEKMFKQQEKNWKITDNQRAVFATYFDLVFRLQDTPDVEQEQNSSKSDASFEEKPPARSRVSVPSWAVRHVSMPDDKDWKFTSWWDPADAIGLEEHMVASYSPDLPSKKSPSHLTNKKPSSDLPSEKPSSELPNKNPSSDSPTKKPAPRLPSNTSLSDSRRERPEQSNSGQSPHSVHKKLLADKPGPQPPRNSLPQNFMTPKQVARKQKHTSANYFQQSNKGARKRSGANKDVESVLGQSNLSIGTILERATNLLGAAEQEDQYASNNLSNSAAEKRRRLLRSLRTVLYRLRCRYEASSNNISGTSKRSGKPVGSRNTQDAVKQLALLLKKLVELRPSEEANPESATKDDIEPLVAVEPSDNESRGNGTAKKVDTQGMIRDNSEGETDKKECLLAAGSTISFNEIRTLDQVWIEVPLGHGNSVRSADRYYYNAYTRRSAWALPSDKPIIVVPHHHLGDFIGQLKQRLNFDSSHQREPADESAIASEWSRMRSNIIASDVYFSYHNKYRAVPKHRETEDEYSSAESSETSSTTGSSGSSSSYDGDTGSYTVTEQSSTTGTEQSSLLPQP